MAAALLCAYVFVTHEDAHSIAEKVRGLADYGFSFATSILSFLIAGFTIYITVTKTELLLFFSSERDPDSGLPWIKHMAFIFLRVMAIYVIFCLLCVGIRLFCGQGGAVTVLLDRIPPDPVATKGLIAKIGFVVVGSALVHILLLLQSFIFNIYHTAILAICWEREQNSNQK